MVQVGPASVATARPGAAAGTSFVEWGAVFAGALTAAALSFVLLTFGAAEGVSRDGARRLGYGYAGWTPEQTEAEEARLRLRQPAE